MTQSAPNLISVLRDDHGCLGFIKFSARGYRAFDGDGREIGMYGDKRQAVEAILSVGDSIQCDCCTKDSPKNIDTHTR